MTATLEQYACPITTTHAAHVYRPAVVDPNNDHTLYVGLAEFWCPGRPSHDGAVVRDRVRVRRLPSRFWYGRPWLAWCPCCGWSRSWRCRTQAAALAQAARHASLHGQAPAR